MHLLPGETFRIVTYPQLYSADELALMWCKLNAGKHPLKEGWGFDPENVAGAMALIVILIGPAKCLARWRKESLELRTHYEGLERRKNPRG